MTAGGARRADPRADDINVISHLPYRAAGTKGRTVRAIARDTGLSTYRVRAALRRLRATGQVVATPGRRGLPGEFTGWQSPVLRYAITGRGDE